jgi:hypothetical protein
MTAVAPAHRCGAVPESHRVLSYDTPALAGVNRPQPHYKHTSGYPQSSRRLGTSAAMGVLASSQRMIRPSRWVATDWVARR